MLDEQSPVYFTNLVVRAAVDASAVEPAVRRALFEVNKGQGDRTSGRSSNANQRPRPAGASRRP